MIKKLKLKFVTILMSIVFILLAVIFLFVLTTTKQNIEKNSRDFLVNISFMDASIPEIDGMAPETAGNEMIPFEMRMPFLVLQLLPEGAYRVDINQSYYATGLEIDEVVQAVTIQEEDYGALSAYPVRYLRTNMPDGVRIAIVDITAENMFFAGMVRNCVITGLAALLVFFVISIFLAGWATKPVQQSWEAQKRFVADASHELKTPLTVILSNAEMLSTDKYLKNQEKLNNRILNVCSEAKRMKALVEDLLSLARHDSVEYQPPFSRVDLSYIVSSTVLKFEAAVYDQEKTLNYDIAGGIFITGNEEQLQKLLSIFIDNAIKYSPKGCAIHIALYADKSNQAVLFVHNEGSLIAPEEINKIFGRFYRISEERQNHGGFGLGLSIAQNIAKAHKCKITVESGSETGTTFFAWFPFQ